MAGVEGKLTVYFEDPFWVGVFERHAEGELEVCRVVFGPEPRESQLHEFVLHEWNGLRFSKGVREIQPEIRKMNPKRLQKRIHKQTQETGIGTKSQQALKQQFEDNKQEKSDRKKFERSEIEERSFQLRRQKIKEKHKGH